MSTLGFEPTVSADERPHTYALDRAATGIGFGFVGEIFPFQILGGSPFISLLTENIRDCTPYLTQAYYPIVPRHRVS